MYIDDHILYHGAVSSIPEPLAHVGRPDLDFGPIYRFDQERFLADGDYAMKIFPEYNVEWLDFIAYSRKGQQPWKGLDWIEGGIANDGVISTVDSYIDGKMTPEMAMGELIKENLRHQVCILNQEIIDRYITFVEPIEI